MRTGAVQRAMAASISSNARSALSNATSANARALIKRGPASAAGLTWYRVPLPHPAQFRWGAISSALNSPSTLSTAASRSLNIEVTPHLFTRLASIQAHQPSFDQPEITVSGCDKTTQLTLSCIASHKPRLSRRANSSRAGWRR